MARFCVVVAIVVCFLVTDSYGSGVDPVPATNTCSVKRSGVLTMFNGQTSTVAVPCMYRLADIQCGDYNLVVTPGSKLDSNNTFSPDTVWVKIQKSGLKETVAVRTASSRLQKFVKGKAPNPWSGKKGNLNSFGLEFADFDPTRQAVVLRKDGVFEVEFSADQASVVVRCFSDSFSSTSQPDALCGDGQSGTSTTTEEILGMVFSNNQVFQTARSSCRKAFSVYQRCAAPNAADTWVCNEILLKQVTVDCLAGSGTPLIDHYRRCLKTACNLDNSAREPMIRYIDDNNCALDPGSDCSKATFVKCDSKSTCEDGVICKRKLNQTCADFSDHCINGTTCDPDTKICVTEDNSPCEDDQFQCKISGWCIAYYYLCDDDSECSDGSDDTLDWCPPRGICSGPHKFQCGSGECRPISQRCDGYDDCDDGSDEKNCSEYDCPKSTWRCQNKDCVNKDFLCDGRDDCADGSDERNCSDWKCSKSYWQCQNGLCVHKFYVCDGFADCDDGSDEKNCGDWKCSGFHWQCPNGICIFKEYVCNGRADCDDGSDEKNCVDWKCPSYSWKCRNSRCVRKSYLCDDFDDCGDGSDERNCA